jgi:hypothetical protein
LTKIVEIYSFGLGCNVWYNTHCRGSQREEQKMRDIPEQPEASIKRVSPGGSWWLSSIILATQEAEIKRIIV